MTAVKLRAGRPRKLYAEALKWGRKYWNKGASLDYMCVKLKVSRATLCYYANRQRWGAHPEITLYHPRTTKKDRDTPVPSIFRCSCGGRSDAPEGHPGCQRGAA